jgi:hypothetical protein
LVALAPYKDVAGYLPVKHPESHGHNSDLRRHGSNEGGVLEKTEGNVKEKKEPAGA